MRWFWIDRFVEFESGSRARAVKNISLAEDHLHDHFPGYPVMPGTLMIEGMAQTSGILLGEMSGFDALIILAKVPKVVFHSLACPETRSCTTQRFSIPTNKGAWSNARPAWESALWPRLRSFSRASPAAVTRLSARKASWPPCGVQACRQMRVRQAINWNRTGAKQREQR